MNCIHYYTRGNINLVMIFLNVGMKPIKGTETRQGYKLIRRLPYYGNMVEKKA